LRAGATAAGGHCRLVGAEQLDEFVLDGVPRIFKLVCCAFLDRLIGEKSREGDLVDGGVKLGDRRRRRKGESDDANSTLTERGGVEDGGLENDERRSDRVLNLNFDGVGLVHWDGGKREKVGRADEEVAMEGAHADACDGKA
jgi:hypothetical protein